MVKRTCINLLVMAVASLLAIVVCEFAARFVVNPADYLKVEVVGDRILGGVPSPSTMGGFDAWGFRNRRVPAAVDIVAIGDSHTYGNTAKMEDAWPQTLERLTGRRVYNMGMGGYGPNQYYHLLKTKALALKPQTIVCGLYMGDDFENAYLVTYGLDHWAYLRELPASQADFNIWRENQGATWHKRARVWLSRHSVLYMLVVHGPILGRIKGDLQIENATKLYENATALILPEKGIREAFLPKGILARLNLDDYRIREGMRITFRLLGEMSQLCRERGVEFIVAVIPTKEMVFAEYLEHNPKVAHVDMIDQLLKNERQAREGVFAFLSTAKIPHVDTLPMLRNAVDQQLYAHTAADMHPGKNGYAVIGKAILPVVASSSRHD